MMALLDAHGTMDAPVAELRETTGITSRLILEYAEREGGRTAVAQLLRHAGCADREAELRDERAWFSRETKLRLFEALCVALDDPGAVRRAGAAVLDLRIAGPLRLALRALGSPPMVYRNIVRANSNFTASHTMDLQELRGDRCTLVLSVNDGSALHPLECDYSQGLLSAVPRLFGLPPARVRRTTLGTGADQRCLYEVRWRDPRSAARGHAAVGLAAGVALVAAELAVPVLRPFAVALCILAIPLIAIGAHRRMWAQRRHLQGDLQDREAAADGLIESLQELVAELDLDEVLDKIVQHAGTALGSKDVVLVVDDEDAPRAPASSGVPEDTVQCLEAWVLGETAPRSRTVLIDEVGDVPALAGLAAVGSVCSAPLTYHGTTFGALIALSPQPSAFLARDAELVASYAIPAAIALANARHFAVQRSLATRDPLTGLLNHREFHESVDRELARARRSGSDVGVVLFDLNDFKIVNDTAGHAEGDRILCAVAGAMEATCRESDMAFRVGGDEFALLLPGSDRAAAAAAAGRAQQAIGAIDDRIGAAFGVASWPADGGSKDVLLADADAALYAMKSASREGRSRRGPDAHVRHGVVPRVELREKLLLAGRLAAELSHPLDPARIAAATVRELHHSFGYSLVCVQRVDGEELSAIALGGAMTETLEVPRWTRALTSGISGRVARTGRTALVHDTTFDRDHVGVRVTGIERELVLRSQLAVPLRVGSSIWGVLSVQQAEPTSFGLDDIVLLELVGAEVAAALLRHQLQGDLDTALAATFGVLSDTLEVKDRYTAEHSRHVGDLAREVALQLDLDDADLQALHYAALLHDVGKLGIRADLLAKQGPLTEAEREEMQQHSAIGAEMLQNIPFFSGIHPLVRAVHERWDGAGYPDRIGGEAIPLGARIIAVCDAFDAMTSDRSYRAAMPLREAIRELRRCAGTQFDPQVVDLFIAINQHRDLPATAGPAEPGRQVVAGPAGEHASAA